MRREAALATLVLLAAVGASPTSSAWVLFTCEEKPGGQGNAWKPSPDCNLDEVGSSEPMCPGMLPPGPLTATWTPEGVLLEWSPPLAGEPAGYNVYRLTMSEQVSGRTEIVVAAVHPPEPRELPGGGPVQVAVGYHQAERLAPFTLVYTDSNPDPYGSVPGSETRYLDAAAQSDGAYAYWVQGFAPGCEGPMSTLAFSFMGHAFPSGDFPPHWEECFYWDPPDDPPSQPSARCLEGTP